MVAVRVCLPPKLVPVFDGEADVRGAFGGRGSGKTRSFAKMTAVRAYMWDKAGEEGIILCARQFMNSLDDSSMEEVKAAIRSEPWLEAAFDIGEKYIRTKSGRIRYTFTGLDRNIDSVKSKSRIKLCWVDEAEPVTDEAWVKLIPTLREDDSELWVTWNPESKRSATHLRFRCGVPDERIKIVELNWRDNPWFPASLERTRQRDKRDRVHQYDHIWEGDFATVYQGAYYTPELIAARDQGRITKVEHEPLLKTYAVWDLGKGPHMAIWVFQVDGSNIRVLRYLQGQTDEGIPTMIRYLDQMGYKIEEHYVPHDAKVKELGSEMTRVETLLKLGQKPKLVTDHRVRDGINAVKEVLARCWFDAEATEYGLDALRQYRSAYNETNMVFSDGPLKDWTNHAADAFRYLAMSYRERFERPAPKPKPHDETALIIGEDGKLVNAVNVMQWAEKRLRRKQLGLD